MRRIECDRESDVIDQPAQGQPGDDGDPVTPGAPSNPLTPAPRRERALSLEADGPVETVLRETRSIVAAMVTAESATEALESALASLGALLDARLAGYWSRTLQGGLERRATWSARPDTDAAAALPERFTRAERLRLGDDPELATLEDDSTAVTIPTTRAGEPAGIVRLVGGPAMALDASVLRALAFAGGQIGEIHGVLEERHELVETLSRLALTDELTGLPNRRAWEEAVRRELARAVRDGHPVCIAVLDLDGFKRFNDEYGHQAGDRALAASARAWQAQLRTSDVLARYGGEEFAALIRAWPLQTAVDVIERVRRATAADLTASAGIAGWDGVESGEELFGRADAALYEAKQSGRDRTIAALAATHPDRQT